MLDGHEVEGLVLGVGKVAAPQLQAVVLLFPGDGSTQQGIEGLPQRVGLVPIDVARGAHVGGQGEHLVHVIADLERVIHFGKQGVHRGVGNTLAAVIHLAVVVILERRMSETIT